MTYELLKKALWNGGLAEHEDKCDIEDPDHAGPLAGKLANAVSELFDADAHYLRGLADRLMRVPVMYGTDQSDVDRLVEIARKLS